MELAKEAPARVVASSSALAAAGEDERPRWRNDGAATLRGRGRPTELAVPTADTAVPHAAGAER